MTELNEAKYQALRLYHSNQISLKDLKALFRITTVVSQDEYLPNDTKKHVLGTRDRIEKIKRLGMTRGNAQLLAALKFKSPSPLIGTREEHIAEVATNFRVKPPHDWRRYGPLIKRTKRYNPPRPGSSKGKIGRSKFLGFAMLNKDLDGLFNAIERLIEIDARNRTRIKQKLKSVRQGIGITAK